MKQTKQHEFAVRKARPAPDGGDAIILTRDMARLASSAALARVSTPAQSNLAALKTVISDHNTLLAKVRRRNDALRDDNARMERELARRTEEACADDGVTLGKDNPLPATDSHQHLHWIDDYLHGTLAQTLWALAVRAARLEEHATDSDREEARRILELTRAAYDQLRYLMAALREKTDD